MASTYVEEYANKKGISVAEAMQHAVVKEYLKYHPADAPEKTYTPVQTTIKAGCGSALENQEEK